MFSSYCFPLQEISTHALTEGDRIHSAEVLGYQNFNSRPHGGRPVPGLGLLARSRHFNSRPHGGRRVFILFHSCTSTFQLTPSRRATARVTDNMLGLAISTHALTEGDVYFPGSFESISVFQLTPSRRATTSRNVFFRRSLFQLTPSRRATVLGVCFRVTIILYFNSRPHGGRRLTESTR